MYVYIWMGGGVEKGTKTSQPSKFHLFMMHWLILVCALTRDQTRNLGTSG